MTNKQSYLAVMGFAILAGLVTTLIYPKILLISLFYFIVLFLINAWVLRGEE